MAHDLERTGAVRRLPMLALLSANAVSMSGNAIANVAIPWFVLETTGSAAKLGLTSAVIALSNVLAAFFGGPVVDRLGYKRLSVLADVMSGAAVALVPLPVWALAFSPPLWVSVAALAAAGLANGPIDPLIFTSIQERTPGRLLARVNGASLALARGAAPIAATLAGWSLGAFGLRPVLVAIASGLLVVSLTLVSTPALREMDATEDR